MDEQPQMMSEAGIPFDSENQEFKRPAGITLLSVLMLIAGIGMSYTIITKFSHLSEAAAMIGGSGLIMAGSIIVMISLDFSAGILKKRPRFSIGKVLLFPGGSARGWYIDHGRGRQDGGKKIRPAT